MKAASEEFAVTPTEAVAIQRRLAETVITDRALDTARLVAGIDVSVKKGLARAAIVVLSWPDLSVADQAVAEQPAAFPYVPGLLTFREGPVVLDAWTRLARIPDLVIYDGQGVAHPRRMGIAAHLGVVLGVPSIGCAKTRLCGEYQEPGTRRGDWSFLVHQGEIVGAVLRTRANVSPVFVSAGHLIDLPSSIFWTLNMCTKYRLPETTRAAHRLAGGKAA